MPLPTRLFWDIDREYGINCLPQDDPDFNEFLEGLIREATSGMAKETAATMKRIGHVMGTGGGPAATALPVGQKGGPKRASEGTTGKASAGPASATHRVWRPPPDLFDPESAAHQGPPGGAASSSKGGGKGKAPSAKPAASPPVRPPIRRPSADPRGGEEPPQQRPRR